MPSDVLTYTTAGNRTDTINLVEDLSIIRFKDHQHTDGRGYVRGYMCNIAISASDYQSAFLSLIPNSWKMRNAFRKWHAYREKMFKDAGVRRSEMGKYGHTIRPYMNDDHKANGQLTPLLGGGFATGGEWTYTSMASTPGWQASGTGTGGQAIVDKYTLTVLDENTVDAVASGTYTTLFSNCGMIHCYNLDRMSEVTPSTGETISGPNNPLAMIRSGSTSAGEVVDIAEDQELEAPPYDIAAAGDSVEAALSPYFRCVPHMVSNTYVESDGTVVPGITKAGVGYLRDVFIPAGLFQIHTSDATDTIVQVEVLAEVLCKDYDRL